MIQGAIRRRQEARLEIGKSLSKAYTYDTEDEEEVSEPDEYEIMERDARLQWAAQKIQAVIKGRKSKRMELSDPTDLSEVAFYTDSEEDER